MCATRLAPVPFAWKVNPMDPPATLEMASHDWSLVAVSGVLAGRI